MRKTFILSAAALILLAGCNKEKSLLQKEQEDIPKSAMSTDILLLTPNTTDWAEMADGYDDIDSRRRHAKLFLSIGLAEVVKDTAIAAWILNEVPQHEDSVFYFEQLFAQYPATKSIIESTIDPLGLMTGWSFEQVQDHMQYDEYDIRAGIFLVNTPNAVMDNNPLVSPGFDIEDDEINGDITFVFYTDTSNVTSRYNISEEQANTINMPMIAVDERAVNILDLINRPGEAAEADYYPNRFNTDVIDYRVAITQYQISQLYDKTGNCEFNITGRKVTEGFTGQNREFLKNGCNNPQTMLEYEIAKIPQSGVWTLYNTDKYFAWYHCHITDPFIGDMDWYGAPAIKRLFFNTYERDWFASPKELSPTSINGYPINLKGQRTGYNEWYSFDPKAGTNLWWNQYGKRLYGILGHGVGYTYDMWMNQPGKCRMQLKNVNWCSY